MRYLLFWLLLFTAPGALSAQRAFKPVKLALKAKNYGEAIKQINQLRQDSVYRDAPKLCIYSMEAYQGQNDAQNMKLYLKQSYDTLAFFSTTYQIVNEAIRLDSLEQQLRVTEEQKPKYQNQVKEQLRRYFPNLLVGARFFYKRGKYQEAMPYLRRCLDLPETPLGKDAGLPTKAHQSNASLYVVCAYNTQQYDEVHRYQEWALADTLSRATILECLINTAAAEKDSFAYLQGLQTAWQEFADKPAFFTRLVDYYALRGNYPEVLALVGKQLERNPMDASARLAECMANLNLENFDACIETGKLLLQADTSLVDVNYYVGAAYVAKALLVTMPDNALSKTYQKASLQRKSYLKDAEPYLEFYRKLAPKDTHRWAPLLYKVYLGLNRGDKFAEIEAVLKAM